MADDVILIVDGRRYGGWKSIRVTRSIESIAGSFALDVSDRWDGEIEPWPIAEGDKCRVLIDDVAVIDGYIDKRGVSASKDSRALTYSGRDRAGDLVDCSAIVSAGSVSQKKWTFYNVDVAQLATEIARPFGIAVSVQAGLGAVLTKDKKVVLHPGDTCYEVISRAAGAAGVLVVSDAAGGIVITRAGTARATSLIEGQNILSASVEYDAADRFHHYLISSQVPGSDDESAAEEALIQAEAFDNGVRRTARVILIRPDKGYTIPDAKRRADWEARIRAARAERVTITVQGWRQSNGMLWPLNTLTRVRAPRLIGVDGDLLISQVEHTIGDGGRVTQLSLVRPDAFTPEPAATVAPSDGIWKEITPTKGDV
jgi:prophage tail gpP-like protein